MKRRLLRALGLTLAGLAPFLVAEAALRIVGYHPPEDPYLAGFVEGEPIFERDGGDVVVEPTQRRAWRTAPFPATPEPGVLRIFSVGDSITWGHRGNEYPDPLVAYSDVLEELLRARVPGGTHRVVNTGARTFGSGRVARVVAEVLGYAPDVVVVHVGTSEHLESRLREERAWLDRREPRWFWSSRLIGALRTWLHPPAKGLTLEELRARDDTLTAAFIGPESIQKDAAERAALVENATRNLTAIADACERAGVPLVLATVGSDLRYPPFATRWADEAARTEGEDIVRRAGALLKEGKAADAKALLEPAVAARPEAAALHYRLAEAKDALGDTAGAGASYRAAKDADACPARALSEVNDAIRRLADARPGVHLVDIERLLVAAVPDGVPDARLFLDNCHPRPEVHRLIAEEVYRILHEAGLLVPAAK